jgi:ribonuclease HI
MTSAFLVTRYKKHADYSPSSPVVHIYTDGSTIGNGYKHATGGYGVFIPGTDFVAERLIIQEMVTGKVTNNVAELNALLRALEEIAAMPAGLKYIIHYDSTYAADVVTGKKSAKANLELVQKCRAQLQACRDLNLDVEFKHIYSHTGKQDLHSIGNEVADKLAGQC